MGQWTKCVNADAYQALSPPKCAIDHGGLKKPCTVCVEKWQKAQHARIIKANVGTRHEAKMCAQYGDKV